MLKLCIGTFFAALAALISLPAAAESFDLVAGDNVVYHYEAPGKDYDTIYTKFMGGNQFRSHIGRGGHNDQFYTADLELIKNRFWEYKPHHPMRPEFELGATWEMSFTKIQRDTQWGQDSNSPYSLAAACVVQELDPEKVIGGETYDAGKVVCNVGGDLTYTQTRWYDRRTNFILTDELTGDMTARLEITKMDLQPR